MAAKRYSAGAIFLQVVPVFANVQRAIEDESKNIDRALGDSMEKSGERAGTRAGKAASESMNREVSKGSKQMSADMERDFREATQGMNKALDDIDTKNLGKKLRSEVKGMRRDLESLNDVDLTIDDNVDKVAAKVKMLREQIEGMRKRSKVFFDIEGLPQVYRKLAEVEKAANSIHGKVDLDVDTHGAERQIGSFERRMKSVMDKAAKHIGDGPNKELGRLRDELQYLSKLRVGVDIGATQLKREVAEITAELKKLAHEDPEIDVKFDAGRAYAEMAPFIAAMDRIDGRTLHVDTDVDTDRASRSLFRLTKDGDSAANTFRSFNAVLFAAAAAGPALVPILGAIAGGLLAIGPAAAVAGAGIGSVLVGFSGIGDALTALQAREDQYAGNVAQNAKTEESAAQRVADARRSASRAVASALDRQADAQRRYKQSIADVADAEQALREAREAAKGTGADLNRKIEGNKLAIDQALLDSFHATSDYDSVLADGSATNAEKEQARIDREQAILRLKELRAEQRDLAKEKKKWDKEGVNGTDEVQSAQDRLNDAIQSQKDAYRDLGRAAQAVDQARADGARQVAEAIRAQGDAMDSVSSQQRNVDAAFDKLGLAGKNFALFLFDLRKDFYAFRDDVQAVLLPAVQEAIEGFLGSDSAKVARDALIGLAASFGEFAKALSASFQGQIWMEFFEMLNTIGPDIQEAYGRAFITFLEAMASILTTLAPYALDFANGLAKLSEAFRDWADSKSGQDAIRGFMDYVESVAPDVIKFVGALARAAANVARGLAEWGEVTLDHITDFLGWVAQADPKTVAAVTTAILVLITASQTAYAVVSTLLAAGALIGSTVGIVVFAVAGIGLALAYLYKTNEKFRDFAQKAWAAISDAVMSAWHDSIEPALEELIDALQVLWHEVLAPFFAWLGPIVIWAATKIIPLLGKWFGLQIRAIAFLIKNVWVPIIHAMVDIVEWTWKHVLKPTWNAISSAAQWLWKHVLKPAFEGISASWEAEMKAMDWVWDHILKPVFDFITDKALPGLEGAFETTVRAISKVWEGLKKVVGAPIKFVLDTIINDGLIAGFNKVASWVHMDGFDKIPIPKALQSYATGGVMPGYTPGRDVHQFVSPTAGRLELSGGEAVMRPEWTQAVGADTVHQMNAIARSQGVNGIRKMLAGGRNFFLGGILPLFGAHSSQHTSGYPWAQWAGDLNYGAGYDDYGMPIHAWKKGVVAQMQYLGDRSYGRYVVLNHAGGQNSLYAHMSAFGPEHVGQSVPAGALIGRVGDLGNTGTPPTSHLHFEVRGGSVDYADSSGSDGKGGGHRAIPGWLMGIVKNPLNAVKDWITGPLDKATEFMKDSPVFDAVTKAPLLAAQGVTDKVWSIVPGWVKTAAGWAGDAADWVVGGVKNAAGAIGDAAQGIGGGIKSGVGAVGDALGLATGGILPYNGTMMYDNGGYLPPGLTTVVNLTGKPEPVFTSDQWDGIDSSAGAGNIHYEPHFEGSDLTPEDVAGDLNFTFRRIRRGGKYEGVGS